MVSLTWTGGSHHRSFDMDRCKRHLGGVSQTKGDVGNSRCSHLREEFQGVLDMADVL